MTRIYAVFPAAIALTMVSLLAGCASTGTSKISDSVSKLSSDVLSAVESVNPFEQRSIKLASLQKEKRFDEAERFVISEKTYFQERYKEKSASQELGPLSQNIWGTQYASKLAASESELAPLDLKNQANWQVTKQRWDIAELTIASYRSNFILFLTKEGSSQIQRLQDLLEAAKLNARAQRGQVIEAVAESVIQSGQTPSGYPGADLTAEDFRGSLAFQARLAAYWAQQRDRPAILSEAKRLAGVAGEQAKAEANLRYMQLLTSELTPSGKMSLENVVRYPELATFPFPDAKKPPLKLARIGLIDLTAAQFRDRNRFDFEVKFHNDLGLDATDAKLDAMSTAGIADYDYLFVVDLSSASIDRRFKENKSLESRFQSGTRQEANSNYVSAMTEYQKALADYQGVQVQNAGQRCNSVAACLILGAAQGIAEAGAKSRVDNASANLRSTPQTLSVPIFSSYSYRRVTIDATKSAMVDYYIIDVKGRQYYKNNFNKTEAKAFEVAYSVHNDDPDRSSILRNVQTEDQVVAWEKSGLTVPLKALFDPKNLATAKREPFSGIEKFLASFEKRQYAQEKPGSALRQSPSSKSVIADSRFDSVVLIRTPKGLGTGFYVTPELVLTAYHVVNDVQLVEMSFFDGSVTYGKVVDHDLRLDLALVRAQRVGKPVAIFDGQIRLGSTVEAIGHPRGLEFTITRGVISALRKQKSMLTGSAAAEVEFVQTDTPASPGNSGGPLFLGEHVVGVIDNARVDKGSQNLNFSVSFNEIRGYLQRFGVK